MRQRERQSYLPNSSEITVFSFSLDTQVAEGNQSDATDLASNIQDAANIYHGRDVLSLLPRTNLVVSFVPLIAAIEARLVHNASAKKRPGNRVESPRAQISSIVADKHRVYERVLRVLVVILASSLAIIVPRCCKIFP